jgi:nicotinate-nucleotide adenylyltransferase
VLSETSKWKKWNDIQRLAKLVVLGRVGAEHPDAPMSLLPDVSSTRIRSLLEARATDGSAHDELARCVPRSVLEYVDAHGLYQ